MAGKKNNSRKTNSRSTGSAKKAGSKSNKKTNTGRASSSAKRTTKKPVQSAGIAGDIILLVALAAAVLIFAFNFGVGGPAGNKISEFLRGIFGYAAYVVPFYIFFAIAFYIANKNNPLIVRKTVGLIMLLIFLCAVITLVTEPDFSRENHISDYYYNGEGGGFIGGALVHLFTLGFSSVIAWILTIVGTILSLIILTQKPLLSKLGITTKMTAMNVRRRRNAARESDDEDDDIDYDDEEDMASVDAIRKSERRKKFPIFNLLPFGSKGTDFDDEIDESDDDEEDWRQKRRSSAQNNESGEEEKDNDDYSDSDLKKTSEKSPAGTKPKRKSTGKTRSGKKNTKAGKTGNGGDPSSYADDSKMPAFLRATMKSREQGRKEDPNSDEEYILSDTEADERKDLSEGPDQPDNTDIIIEGTGISPEDTAAISDGNAEETAIEKKKPARRQSTAKTRSTEEEIVSGINSITNEISTHNTASTEYVLPQADLLTRGKVQPGDSRQHLIETAQKLEQIFRDFGVNVHVNNVSRGPTVTRYELTPEQGVKVSRIVALTDDIKLNLAASEIRIEAPIPGKAAVGIEVPNKESSVVAFRDLVESNEFVKSKAPLTFAVGKDIAGKPVISDIAKMPHLLIAGATGSGKSVCINTLIMSVLMKSTPDEVRMLMIDPKVVELKIYDGIPHLLIPVVTDPKKAAGALNWAVQEMNERYNKFAEYTGVRDLKSYNKRIEKINEKMPPEERLKKLPQILIIVDELADLMMVAPGEVEDAICRLAQLARAAGLHLVIATQRPSVNVVTGLIKANMPSRIALAVSSGVDSRTIIDMNGAEKLLGHGDMLFAPQGYPKPARVQGAYISDDDISRVVKYLSQQNREIEYNKEVESEITRTINNSSQPQASKDSGRDEYFVEAGRFIIEKDKASIGMLQRMFKIGFNRAARIMDQLCDAGVVSEEEGTKARKVLMDAATFEEMFGQEE